MLGDSYMELNRPFDARDVYYTARVRAPVIPSRTRSNPPEVVAWLEIRNQASIVFDTNEPIQTPEWRNTIDNTKPTSQISPLSVTQNSTSFEVHWSGTDEGAGIRDYTVFVSEDGGPFIAWLMNTPETSDTFLGEDGKTYGFYSVARDQTGNLEDAPEVPDATTTVVANQPPVADSGPDQIVSVDSNCMASVTLDGSDSSDPDGDPLTYTWTWDSGSAIGVSPTIQLPLGASTITLVVNDGTADSEPDTVGITVIDNTPPEISVSVDQDTLWPPNHKMVLITPTITATDNCDTGLTIELTLITMNEGDETNTYDPNFDSTIGDGHRVNDIQVDENDDIYLRAERSGTGSGRIYTITYTATDASGNTTTASVTVTVPHDQR